MSVNSEGTAYLKKSWGGQIELRGLDHENFEGFHENLPLPGRGDGGLDLLHRVTVCILVLEQVTVGVIGHRDRRTAHDLLHTLWRPVEIGNEQAGSYVPQRVEAACGKPHCSCTGFQNRCTILDALDVAQPVREYEYPAP